jgi:hypothetical protein
MPLFANIKFLPISEDWPLRGSKNRKFVLYYFPTLGRYQEHSQEEADMEQRKEASQEGPAAREGMEALVARLTPAQQQEFYRVTASLAIACSEAIRQVLEAMAGPAQAEPRGPAGQ